MVRSTQTGEEKKNENFKYDDVDVVFGGRIFRKEEAIESTYVS